MNIYTLLTEVQVIMLTKMKKMKKVRAEEVGLDERAGTLRVDDDCVIVSLSDDGKLQYYGGFEYIDRECRTIMGDYVIYTKDGGRVDTVIDLVMADAWK